MSKDEAKGRNRSPNYPYLTLPDAINKTCVVLEKDKLSPTSPEVIAGHLGYAQLHGTSRRVLAAMKEYGLLEDAGSKRFRVSNLGYRLCKNNEPTAEREKLLKEAALKPFIFRAVIEHFKGDIPSPANVEDYLILEKEFSPDGASSFQKVLRETAEFANISSEDFSENTTQSGNLGGTMDVTAQTNLSSSFADFIGQPKNQAATKQESDVSNPLFRYNVPLSYQRNVNAQLIITGDSLTKRDLSVLARKVKDLIDAFDEDGEEELKDIPPQTTLDFQEGE
jgi:hypothetical protein